jgi:hypothetical protein
MQLIRSHITDGIEKTITLSGDDISFISLNISANLGTNIDNKTPHIK